MNGHQSAPRRPNVWWQILLLFVLLVPIILLFTTPRFRSSNELMVIFTLILVANLILLWLATRRRRQAPANAAPPVLPRMLDFSEIPPAIQDVLDVKEAAVDDDMFIFRGKLRENSEAAFERLKQEYAGRATPLLQEDPRYGHAIFLGPDAARPLVEDQPSRPWVHWLLFALTLLTTCAAGATQEGADVLRNPRSLVVGLPYAVALMAILGFHELGHYFTARHYRIHVTPPFFIPVPFALGTFGAFIKMRSAPEDRRSLFDVAVAGPFAGLVVAVPALFFGLRHSTIVAPGSVEDAMSLGFINSSILVRTIEKLSVGSQFMNGDVRLSPLAVAGLLGLLVTALNLLPIGQLDGGHIARAMFGTRAGGWISQLFMFGLFVIAFIYPQYMFWALIVFFIARRVAPPMNDVTRIGAPRMWLGILAFVILALILLPMPEALWNALNGHQPEPETLTI